MSTPTYTIPVDSTYGDLTGHALMKQQQQQQQQLQQQQMLEDDCERKTYVSLEPAVNNTIGIHNSKHSFADTALKGNDNTDIRDLFDWSLHTSGQYFMTFFLSSR